MPLVRPTKTQKQRGCAVTEPEPPPGGFLWDLMDGLWFAGAAACFPTLQYPFGLCCCLHALHARALLFFLMQSDHAQAVL